MYQSRVDRKLPSEESGLRQSSCVRLCVHICVSEHGHAHTIACMAADNNLECQFLLSALGRGLLLVAAELGILLSPSSLSLYEC